MLVDSSSFSECTTKEEVIQCYFQQLNNLKALAKRQYAIESNEFAEIFAEYSEQCTTPITAHSDRNKQKLSQFNKRISKCVVRQLRRASFAVCLLAITFVLVTYRVDLTQLFMRNIQIYIYPGMRFWRKFTLPIIQQFPKLTEFYDETCLVSNPLFRVANLDCTPCTDVISVVDLTIAPHLGYLDNGIPHIIQQADGVNQSIGEIYQLYKSHRTIFRREANKVYSTDTNVANLDQLFDVMLNKSGRDVTRRSHTLWRINRITPARLIRVLFPTPKYLPLHAGIDIERYVAFDVKGGVTYQLPSTDCSNMFVYQAIGSRMIHLQPTAECKQQCRRLSVILKPNHTLFYDWWYWKPISSPADQLVHATSVSYIGSYC